jgi:hypothetical protein
MDSDKDIIAKFDLVPGSISVTPTQFDFGNVILGASSNFDFVISNTGTVNISGSASGLSLPFSCVSGCSYNLAPLATSSVSIRFAPTEEKTSLNTISFSGGSGSTANVSGIGIIASPCQDHNVWGYAWSENIGWMSFSCKNGSASADYGVDIDNSNPNLREWELFGYAWSEYYGWISFNKLELNNCPSGTCKAWLDTTDSKFYGWARVCSVFQSGCSGTLKDDVQRGGWDGWIKLRKDLSDAGNDYGVYLDSSVTPSEFAGFAWGGKITTGWISFNHKNENNIQSDYVVQTSVVVNAGPTVIFNQDPDNSETYCNIENGQGLINFQWQYSDAKFNEATSSLRVSTVNNLEASNPVIDRNISNTACLDLDPGVGILCNNTQSARIGLDLEFGKTYYWWVRVYNANGQDSGWQQGSGAIGSFTTASVPYPWPAFSWTPTNPILNEVARFDSSSSSVYGSSPSYAWNFGANAVPQTSTSTNATTTFTIGGSRNVTLTITDSIGSCSLTKPVSATLPLPWWEEI